MSQCVSTCLCWLWLIQVNKTKCEFLCVPSPKIADGGFKGAWSTFKKWLAVKNSFVGDSEGHLSGYFLLLLQHFGRCRNPLHCIINVVGVVGIP